VGSTLKPSFVGFFALFSTGQGYAYFTTGFFFMDLRRLSILSINSGVLISPDCMTIEAYLLFHGAKSTAERSSSSVMRYLVNSVFPERRPQ